jgi:peptidoglycan hydrolase CwlO-like protein
MSADNIVGILKCKDGIFRGYDLSVSEEYKTSEIEDKQTPVFEAQTIQDTVCKAERYCDETIVEYGYRFLNFTPDPPTELKHTDDAATQLQKMLQATNEVVRLTNELIEAGNALNEKKGKYREIQAKIKCQKEVINSLKVSIRAEGSHL